MLILLPLKQRSIFLSQTVVLYEENVYMFNFSVALGTCFVSQKIKTIDKLHIGAAEVFLCLRQSPKTTHHSPQQRQVNTQDIYLDSAP